MSVKTRLPDTPKSPPPSPSIHYYAFQVPLLELRRHVQKYERSSDEISRLRGLISTTELNNDCDGVWAWEGVLMLYKVALIMHETALKETIIQMC